MKTDDLTPIRKQYLDIKKQFPDSIVFFRLGDFYETFDHDAEITSKELEIVLTSRNVAKGVRIPMAGIPYHAVDNYLARLIGKGYHVAIAEQIGETQARGLVHREVVRVVTPGTVVEPGMLHKEKNNYLAGVAVDENRIGIAFVDITTGEFRCTEIQSGDTQMEIKAELDRLKPAEVLLPDTLKFEETEDTHTTRFASWHFEFNRAQTNLKKHFNTATLEGFGVNGKTLAICASGAILDYLRDTQPAALKLLSHLSVYSTDEFMNLDAATRRNLELTETIRRGETKGSLLHVLDKTVSPMGHRLIRQWVSNPLIKIDEINNRQECISFFTQQGLLRAEAISILQRVNDLERLISRVIAGHATPRDLVAIRTTLEYIPTLKQLFAQEKNHDLADTLHLIHDGIEELKLLKIAIADNPPATLQNSGVINSGYSSELDQVISASQNARDWINNLERIEKERTGIKTLKVGYNKVFGYFIEVTRANSSAVPAEYIRKQTLVNAERYITPEMKEYETLVLNAEERIRDMEGRIFAQVCEVLSKSSSKLLQTARGIALLDVYIALAVVAVNGNYTRPILTDSTDLVIYDGRHPVVESYILENRFIPNDANFENGEIVRIITGPNMSGKSTFLRQVALIVLMAQIGSFVPASSAKVGITDRIFTRIGAQDEIHAGQSTFMVEMIETANILNHATNRSLLILDEIGRGTSTYDGLSIAWAVVEYIHNHPRLRARTLFATHYHELTQLSELLPGVRNYNVAVTEADNNVVFLHKIVAGGADRSYGIHVGQLAGLPRLVVQRAVEILKQLESSSGKAINLQASTPQQMVLFPETNPILTSLEQIDIDSLSPIEALNKLYEWKRKFIQ